MQVPDQISKTIYDCLNCGGRKPSVDKLGFCPSCNTEEKREKMRLANSEIKKENIAKGFHYAN